MAIDGYIEYKRREYCKDVKCPVQLQMNSQVSGQEKYEQLRQTCRTNCLHTTWEFHHWLIEKNYLILKPEK